MSNLETLEKCKPTINPLASFAWFPPKVHFATQDSEEKVVLLMRRHWITNLGWTIVAVFLFFVPLILNLIQGIAFSTDILKDLSPELKFVLISIWYLLLFGYIFGNFISWYFSVNMVTTKRLLDVDFHSILYKNVSEAELTKVQDITHQTVGTLALLFNFGLIRIQTAAEFSDLEFEAVPNPSEVHKIIGKLLEDVRKPN